MNTHGFVMERVQRIDELDAQVFLLRHRRLGTRVLAVKNRDANKTFCAAFTTAPTDSTGVAHILEHCVLMGSRKYPVKDVFGEINKGGLMTFLNAMTGADATWYPFATRNLREYFNIMDVYCDVCFNPLLERSAFEQEGWHYHKESEEAELSFQGVVLNEMKGAFSDPIRLLFHHLFRELMPGSVYVHESGGDPRHIPDLDHESFVAFHRAHYHPDNAVFFFYGDAPLEDELAFVDQRFLAAFEPAGGPVRIARGQDIAAPVTVRDSYGIPPGEDPASRTFLAVGSTVGTVLDRMRNAAFQVIANILYNSDGSPLKKAVLSAGICRDFGGVFLQGHSFKSVMMTYLVGSEAEHLERFGKVYQETLSRMAAEGIDPDLARAELNRYEFNAREEGSRAQRGLDLLGKALPAMVHGGDPFEALCMEENLREIRQRAGQGWFEELIRAHLLDNPQTVRVILEPDPDKPARLAAEERQRLDAYEASLDQDGLAALIAHTRELMASQARPNDAETLALLPRLGLADLERRLDFLTVSPLRAAGRELLFRQEDCRGIAYLRLCFDCASLPRDLLPCLNLFGAIVTEIGTSRLDYMSFAKEIAARAGGFDHGFSVHGQVHDPMACRPVFSLRLKALSGFLESALDLVAEVLADVNLEERGRIREIVAREFAWAEHSAHSEGYGLAASRALAGFSPQAAFNDAVNGLDAFRYLRGLARNYEAMEEELLERLGRIRDLLFRRDNLFFTLTADSSDLARVEALAPALVEALAPAAAEPVLDPPRAEGGHLALATPAEVVFNVLAGILPREQGHRGELDVLRTWLSRDYLWNTVRQQGGAYGCFVQYNQLSGALALVSYRDPCVRETFAAYEGMATALENLRLDPGTLEQLVIGAYAGFDPHQSPAARGNMASNEYLSGITPEWKQARLEELLGTDARRLRAWAPALREMAASGRRVAIGNRARLEADQDLFDLLEDI